MVRGIGGVARGGALVKPVGERHPSTSLPSSWPPRSMERKVDSLRENLSSNSDTGAHLELSNLRSDSSDLSNDLVSAKKNQ